MTPLPVSGEVVSAAVERAGDRHREAFLAAKPFRHVVIDDFFEPAFAERLLAEFPSFDPKLAVAEAGTVGGKAVNTRIAEISPSYQQLYEAIAARPFLDLVSRLSGIPDLILDPKMFGGGTHDNQHGQELDPHVDFNYDEAMQLHRRLNLIVYLNKGWKSEWGGALEIHSNPRRPFENQVSRYDPLFNRCVMFETNEYSWHGFPRLNLPPEERYRSRKSISIYLYTKERPAEEIAPMHGTFYVQRPLPENIAAGRTLTPEDMDELRGLLIRRDNWIEFYQRMELRKNQEIAERDRMIRGLQDAVRAPLTGFVLQESARGVYWDGWVQSHAELRVRPQEPVVGLCLRAWRPGAGGPALIRVTVDGSAVQEFRPQPGGFECEVALERPASEPFRVSLDFECSDRGLPSNGDPRDLAFLLQEIRMRHARQGTLARAFSRLNLA